MTARRTVRLVALAWGLSPTLIIGCGGEDQRAGATKADVRTDGKPLTVAEYRRRAKALCARAAQDVRQIPEPKSVEQLAGYLEQVVRLSRRLEQEEEQALEPPPEQIKHLHERADRLDVKGLSVLERAIPRIKSSAAPQLTLQKELRKFAPLVEEQASLARKLDLEECIEVGQPAPESGA